jgi:hypothetical protein
MPLKAFFFLVKNPSCTEVEAFRSLIFDEQTPSAQGSHPTPRCEQFPDDECDQKNEKGAV